MSTITPFKYAKNIFVAIGEEHVFNASGDWERFEKGVLNALLEIMKYNWTGFGIIQYIREIGKPIYIVPVSTQEGTCAEDRRSAPGWNGGIKIAIAPSFVNSVQHGPGSGADEVLLHELIHALSIVSGNYQRGMLTVDGFFYHTIEEFIAIVLTNTYISAKHKGHSLRKDHRGFSALEPSLTDNERFLLYKGKGQSYYPHLAQIKALTEKSVKGNLCREFVRHEEATFNPIAYYLNNKQKFEQYFTGLNEDVDDILLKQLRESEELLREKPFP
ncbi:hypothetical protein [Runella sp.]|uniref:hypothetical protein n=1 Tax=Runella sp. TaxID=1960881 RepID=UPI003D144269